VGEKVCRAEEEDVDVATSETGVEKVSGRGGGSVVARRKQYSPRMRGQGRPWPQGSGGRGNGGGSGKVGDSIVFGGGRSY